MKASLCLRGHSSHSIFQGRGGRIMVPLLSGTQVGFDHGDPQRRC